jgi:hypothetical protein
MSTITAGLYFRSREIFLSPWKLLESLPNSTGHLDFAVLSFPGRGTGLINVQSLQNFKGHRQLGTGPSVIHLLKL